MAAADDEEGSEADAEGEEEAEVAEGSAGAAFFLGVRGLVLDVARDAREELRARAGRCCASEHRRATALLEGEGEEIADGREGEGGKI